MKNKSILNIVAGIAVLLLIFIVFGVVFILQRANQGTKGITILTDKAEYNKDDILKIKIRNNLDKTICFSSCFPYYIEEKNGERGWKSYG